MFAPSFARVARSTSSVYTTPTVSLCRVALSTASKPLHQRRYSSSKSSIPPSNKKKPEEELEQNAATQLQDPKADAKSKGKVTKIPIATSADNVPHVPATTHLHEDDVRLSTFFAMHRPIPFYREAWQHPAASMEAIDHMFDAKSKKHHAMAIQHTERTLNEFVENMLDQMAIEEAPAMWEKSDIFEEAQPPTEESIMSHVAQLPSFVPPPPPVAFDSSAQEGTEVALPSEQTQRPATFREHVHRRRRGMLLISVKRQRKLKMKKHKYKKLMKRTRLERRKLDRA